MNMKPEDAFRTFFGLVVADAQIRILLGDEQSPGQNEIKKFANDAVKNFLALCGNPS